jgi:hypothetical protein
MCAAAISIVPPAPACRYHPGVAMELRPAAKPLFSFSGNSAAAQSLRRKLGNRKIWRCPVASCPWVAMLPDEEAEEEERA